MSIPPLPEHAKLPSMLTLYKRDLYVLPDGLFKECLEIPVKVACKLCAHYPTLWSFVMDFIQVGNIEVVEAMEKYEEEDWTVYQLKSYVGKSTKGEIYAYLSRTFDIYIPPTMRFRMIKQREQDVLRLERHLSWEGLFAKEETTVYTGMQRAFDQAKEQKIEQLLTYLPTREREAIQRYYGIGCDAQTSKEIGEVLGVHPDHAKDLVNTAIKRLKAEQVKPAREWIDQDRPKRLQAIYDAHGGKIGVRQLAMLARVHTRNVSVWIKEQKAKET